MNDFIVPIPCKEEVEKYINAKCTKLYIMVYTLTVNLALECSETR